MYRKYVWNMIGDIIKPINKIKFLSQNDNGTHIRFDTSIGSDNLGDYIIMKYCNKILDEMFLNSDSINVATHLQPTMQHEKVTSETKYKFVCGTNLLTSHIEQHWRWILPDGFRRKMNYSNVILMGVGWGEYQDECSDYSRMIYNIMLNPFVSHAVRDEYTKRKLNKIGFKNIINTGCPTTWLLTPEFCSKIPKSKSKDVVTTITDYRQDVKRDNEMLDILSRNYEHVYLWLQGKYDNDYMQKLIIPTNLSVIVSDLDEYEKVLKSGDVDYVGTRLHAGIHALNHYVRSIIISVDNRAKEIAKDINLPIVDRNEIKEKLDKKINESFSTNIHLNQENINQYKNQFVK